MHVTCFWNTCTCYKITNKRLIYRDGIYYHITMQEKLLHFFFTFCIHNVSYSISKTIKTLLKACKTLIHLVWYTLCLQFNFFLFFSATSLKILPLIGSSRSSGQTPITQVLKKIRKLLLEEKKKSANIKKLRCDQYSLQEEEFSSSHITINCKFPNESDLRIFEEYCNSNKLAENLNNYFMTVYREFEFPPYSSTTRKLTFHVTVAEILDTSIPKSTDAHNSLRFVFFENSIYGL